MAIGILGAVAGMIWVGTVFFMGGAGSLFVLPILLTLASGATFLVGRNMAKAGAVGRS